MNYPPRILRSILFLLLPSLILLVFVEFAIHISSQPKSVAAHIGDAFGPTCGKPTIDGEVTSGEWSNTSQQIFFLYRRKNPDGLEEESSGLGIVLGTASKNAFTTGGPFYNRACMWSMVKGTLCVRAHGVDVHRLLLNLYRYVEPIYATFGCLLL